MIRTFLMLTFTFSAVFYALMIVWFWRRREVALAAWRDDGVGGGLPAKQRLQPSAAVL